MEISFPKSVRKHRRNHSVEVNLGTSSLPAAKKPQEWPSFEIRAYARPLPRALFLGEPLMSGSGRGKDSKKGWLFKIGRHSFGGHWHKRFFVLTGNTLVYYKNLPSKNESPVKVFHLGPHCRVEDTGRDNYNGKLMYTFRVYSSQVKPCQVGTRNPEDAAAWMEAIQLAMVKERGDSIDMIQARSIETSSGGSLKDVGDQADLTMSEDEGSPRRPYRTPPSGSLSASSSQNNMEAPDEDMRRASVGGGPPTEFDDMEEVLEIMKDSAVAGEDMEERWRLVKLENGLRFFEEVNDAKASPVPCTKACGSVEAPCDAIFKLVMDLGRSRQEWDFAFEGGNTLEVVDGHTDVIHMRWRSLYLWPIWTHKRDLVLTRYWRRDPDGTYVILYRSTVHDYCPESAEYIRGNLVGGGWIISPILAATPTRPPSSLVVHLLELDARGWLLHSLGFPTAFQNQLLSRIAGIRELFSQTRMDQMTKILSQEIERHPDNNNNNNKAKGGPAEQGESICHTPLTKQQEEEQRLLTPRSLPSSCMVTPPRLTSFKGTLRQGLAKGGGVNCWLEPTESHAFFVRSKSYLVDKKKIPAGAPQLRLVGVDWLKSANRIDHVAMKMRNQDQFQRARIEAAKDGVQKPFFFVVNMQVPGAQHYSMVFYWMSSGPLEKGSLLHTFVTGDDLFRNQRFKLIPHVNKGAWVVKRSVGTTPLIIAGALHVNYFSADNYFEVDVDIGSSTVANGVVRYVLGYVRSLVIDMAFLVQSNTVEELPESLLGTVRISHLEPNSAVDFDLDYGA